MLSTVIVPEPVMAVPEAIPFVNSVDAELNIFVPRAAIILSANCTTINTFSVDADVCGTI